MRPVVWIFGTLVMIQSILAFGMSIHLAIKRDAIFFCWALVAVLLWWVIYLNIKEEVKNEE